MSQPQQRKAAPQPPTNTIDNIFETFISEWGRWFENEAAAPKEATEALIRAKAAINKTIMEARLDELLKTVITIEGFMNGTSSHPAADGLLEINERIIELRRMI